MSYINTKLHISSEQKKRIKNALSSGDDKITIKLKHEDLIGDASIALTQRQVNKLTKAYESGKGTTITLSKAQIKYNMKISGGFLPLLASLAAKAIPILTKTVLPSLATGALSGLASTAASKLMGSGLYLKKGGGVYKMVPQGEGLYLTSYRGTRLSSHVMVFTSKVVQDS